MIEAEIRDVPPRPSAAVRLTQPMSELDPAEADLRTEVCWPLG